MNAVTEKLLKDGCFSKIKGWMHYQLVYERAVAEAPQIAHFVEIGAWKGKSTFFMAACIAGSGKDIAFWTIDTWEGAIEDKHQQVDEDLINGTLFETFKKNTELVKQYITPIQMDSSTAASNFEDESLDFVWIDGDHSFDGVMKDITAWLPKVKPGGVIGGDDYGRRDVRMAVHRFFESVETYCEGIHGKAPVWRIVKGRRPYA